MSFCKNSSSKTLCHCVSNTVYVQLFFPHDNQHLYLKKINLPSVYTANSKYDKTPPCLSWKRMLQ